MLLGVLFTFCVLVSRALGQQEPVVKLPQGDIRGSLEPYSRGVYASYRGIRYAKAPLGPLRFREPESPDTFPSNLDAIRYGSACPQWDPLYSKTVGEEDCLFINVHTPMSGGPPPTDLFPVMVFVHGGNFLRGSGSDYDPQWFLESGVVLVTFNYRLGALGFLSTGDGTGNWGLKDQVLALKWVQDNIRHFGGNSSSVTLFGHGDSVFLHTLSPLSKGLFQRAIAHSGSCEWVKEGQPRNYALDIGRKLGCSDRALVECLRRQTAADVVNAQESLKEFGDYPLRAVPVVERGGFLPETPSKLLSSGDFRPVPIMSGINKDDGAMFYQEVFSYQELLKKEGSSFLLDRLIPLFLRTATDIRGGVKAASHAVLYHYFRGVNTANISQVVQPFVNMSTEAMFLVCNHNMLQNYSARGARTYMYTFEYRGEHSMLDLEQGKKLNYGGVSHGDELLYLFNFKQAPLSAASDIKMKEQLHYLWTTFAKTGESPTTVNYEYPKWEPYAADRRYYLSIGRILRSGEDYGRDALDLWLHHLPALARILPEGEPYRAAGGFGFAMLALAIVLLVVVAVLAFLLYRKSGYSLTNTSDK